VKDGSAFVMTPLPSKYFSSAGKCPAAQAAPLSGHF
jgi:hypothetical protein